MKRLEVIRIRLFNLSDINQVNSLFLEFKKKVNTTGGQEVLIDLLKNIHVENDWSIHLTSLNDSENKRISNMSTHLVETFRIIGMVSHDAWEPMESISDRLSGN